MPGSLQGVGVLADTLSDGDVDCPLDVLVNSPSSSTSERVANHFGAGVMPGDSSTSAGTDSGYFQMPSSLGPMNLADTSSNASMPIFGSGSADSNSSYLPSVTPVDTSNGAGGAAFSGMLLTDGDDGGDLLSELSSSDAIFNVSSSSSQQQGGGGLGEATGGDVADTSGYLPAPSVTTGTNPALDVANQQTPESALLVAGANVSSSSAAGSFPGMATPASSWAEGDLDDFDLPPLPDSVEPSGQVGATGYGEMGVVGYGGSIVTLSTSRTQQN